MATTGHWEKRKDDSQKILSTFFGSPILFFLKHDYLQTICFALLFTRQEIWQFFDLKLLPPIKIFPLLSCETFHQKQGARKTQYLSRHHNMLCKCLGRISSPVFQTKSGICGPQKGRKGKNATFWLVFRKSMGRLSAKAWAITPQEKKQLLCRYNMLNFFVFKIPIQLYSKRKRPFAGFDRDEKYKLLNRLICSEEVFTETQSKTC